jgi:RES domain-containing protein
LPKPKKPLIPAARSTPVAPLGIRELDRFSSESIDRWTALSKDLDELEANLYFALEPERRRLRAELIATLQQHQPTPVVCQGWVRIVDYQFSNQPLSSAGSLTGYGARFNAGMDLDPGTLSPWPALYLAENYETAYREKFQLKSSETVDGLKPEELALTHGRSNSTVLLQGRIDRVFDMTTPRHLDAVAKVLKKIKMPDRAKILKKKLGMKQTDLNMIQSGQGLYIAVLKHNWRVQPAQFGLPARSHILAELVRAAGFEAILYKSTMGPGKCLAVFPDKLSGSAHIELEDKAPPEVKHTRLDENTAGDLAGWHILPPNFGR